MIELSSLDYGIIAVFFSITLIIGFLVSKKSASSSSEYFLSGRNMPWWLLGISMVATTFSTDTPNLVTDIVRTKGVAGNWVWWAFLLTGLLTVFVYAKLWRRSNVSTDMEFYELRYSGWGGRFLRGFRAIYLGVIFNVMAMSGVTLAAIKIGEIMLGLSPTDTILYAGSITVVFSTVGGFRGVVYTDFILFFAAMAGSIGAAYYLVNLPEVGGMANLIAKTPPDILSMTPDLNDPEMYVPLLIVPLAVQWWSSWYPGAEPGGGGYIAQRMLAAKDENHAIGATFFFNVMHYALRPWPWIIVALASLIVFPDLESIQGAFPNISEDKLGHDLAYPAMLTMLPSGLLGLVVASLVAAYMSTISTHLNWGSSYIVNDFYKQQINKNASEKQLVNVGRISTITLFVISAVFALFLTNALQLFEVILMFGAGTGSIFILRWFWWRINAWSEISAMFVSGFVSIILTFTRLGEILFSDSGIWPSYYKFPMVVLFTTLVWIIVTLLTKPDSTDKLIEFCNKTNPGGPGWRKINYQIKENYEEQIKSEMFITSFFSFKGKISRLEYFTTILLIVILRLFLLAIIMVLNPLFLLLGQFGSILIICMTFAVALGSVIAFFAAACKRCHDREVSGWWLFIPFYSFWLLFAGSINKHKNLNDDISEKNLETWSVPLGIVCMLCGCFAIYSMLFSTGYFIYGEINNGISFLIIAIIFAMALKYNWEKLKKLK